MDIFSHGLWAGALFKFLNFKRKTKEKFSFWLAVFWGMFPDLLAFTIPFTLIILGLVFGGLSISQFRHPESMEPMSPLLDSAFNLTGSLYSISHSLIVFVIIFAIAFAVFRKKAFILGAWLLHLVMDIPTHSYQFYPTPIFWPLSGWKFNGFSWGNLYFMIADCILLAAVYFYLGKKTR